MGPQVHSGGDLLYSIDTRKPTVSLGALSRHFWNEGKPLQACIPARGTTQKCLQSGGSLLPQKTLVLEWLAERVWKENENEILERAWVAASEDPIVGTDQKRKFFIDTVRRRFIERPAASRVKNGNHSAPSYVSIKQHSYDFSSDRQTFRASIGKVRTSNPTGIGDDDVVSK